MTVTTAAQANGKGDVRAPPSYDCVRGPGLPRRRTGRNMTGREAVAIRDGNLYGPVPSPWHGRLCSGCNQWGATVVFRCEVPGFPDGVRSYAHESERCAAIVGLALSELHGQPAMKVDPL